MAHPPRPDERRGKDRRRAPPAAEQPAHAEADGELRGVQRQDQGRPGYEADASARQRRAEGDDKELCRVTVKGYRLQVIDDLRSLKYVVNLFDYSGAAGGGG